MSQSQISMGSNYHRQEGGPRDVIRNTFSKEYGVEMSEYEEHFIELEQLGPDANFIDELFPPTRESLCSNWEDIKEEDTKKQWSQITWMRPIQFMSKNSEDIKLFDNIEPNDIKQGLLGDCYFLCSLSSLAERPYLIRRLFETKSYQANGLYSVWLNIDGEWRNYCVDDFIPCKNGKPAFSRANGNELWVLLLEKAYAKAYGSYYKIEGGNPAVALRDLTGAPYINFDEKNPEQMFEFLKEHDKRGSGDILTCYTSPTMVREEQNQVGLYAGHAYSILDVRQITNKNQESIRLVQIRNPWGNGEWNGAWSDNSPLWDDFTTKQVNMKKENDGSFFMCVEDFVNYFEGVGACQVVDDNLYNSIAFKQLGSQSQSIIRLQVLADAKDLTITLNQRDTRFYTGGKYSYSFATMLMVSKNGNQLKWVGGSFDYERNIRINAKNIPAGEYLIILEVLWCQDLYRSIVISCYSDSDCKLSYVSQGLDFNDCRQQAIKAYCLDNSKKPTGEIKVKVNNYNGDQIGRINGSDFGLLFFYFYNQSWNTTLVQSMSFTKLTGYTLPNYFQNKDSINVILPPQKELMLIFKFNAITDLKTEYSFKASLQMMNKDQCKEVVNEDVFMKSLEFNQVKHIENIEAKDRRIIPTNFKLGIEGIDSQESAVTVYSCEVTIVNTLTSLIAPFSNQLPTLFQMTWSVIQKVHDWPTFLFKLLTLYGALLIVLSFDNCEYFDMVLIMVSFIFFSAQVSTRKRMRKILLACLFSTASSVVWFFMFPGVIYYTFYRHLHFQIKCIKQKWNSVDSQYGQLHASWNYLIPIMQLAFIAIKAYLSLIYWKVFVCYDQLIHEVYQKFSDSKKQISAI